MGEAKIFLIPCETNILRPVIRIEVTDSGKMLISRQPKDEIFKYLWWLGVEHMGLSGDRQRTEVFAERLLRLANQSPQS